MPRTKRTLPEPGGFHAIGKTPQTLFVGTPHAVLDQGSSKPVVFQLDDNVGTSGFWVVKAQCRSRAGGRSVIRELAGADLCAWFGLRTPRIGLLRVPTIPPLTDTSPAGEAAAHIYRNDAGKLAFCSKYIEAPRPDKGVVRRKRKPPESMIEDAITMFALDALIWNFNRTEGNPNTLLHEGHLVPIDHGHAFCNIEKIDESGCPPDYTAVPNVDDLRDHVAERFARRFAGHGSWDKFATRFHALTDDKIALMAARWPDELDVGPNGQPTGWKADCVRFLARLSADALVDKFQQALGKIDVVLPEGDMGVILAVHPESPAITTKLDDVERYVAHRFGHRVDCVRAPLNKSGVPELEPLCTRVANDVQSS